MSDEIKEKERATEIYRKISSKRKISIKDCYPDFINCFNPKNPKTL